MAGPGGYVDCVPDATPDHDIGAALAALRSAVDLSQQDIADGMREHGFRWAQPTVHSVEQGRRPLRLAEAVALARLLHVELGALVTTRHDVPLAGVRSALEAEVDAATQQRQAANARIRDALGRLGAVKDLQRAAQGDDVSWSDGPAQAWAALGWMDRAAFRRALLELGVPSDAVDDLTDARDVAEVLGSRVIDAATAPLAADDASAQLWSALRDAIPTLRDA